MAKKKRAATRPTSVSASEFRLVDERGITRALLTMMDNRQAKPAPSLRFWDEEGYERIVIELAPDGSPLVALLDQTGNSVVGAGVSDLGVGVSIRDSDSEMPAIIVQLFPDGTRGIFGLNKAGQTVWEKQWK